MSCEFEDIKCAMPGNFTCKRCKQCGHEVGAPTALVEQQWENIHKNIKANCKNNTENTVEPPPAQNQTTSPPPQGPQDETGPGAQLKKMLSKIGIRATPTCSCNARARYMDFMGVVWCENNLDTIVGWLKEEADKRRLPFIEFAAKALVKRAIAASRRVQQKQHDRQG